jgi:hypothetical protein
MQTEYQRDGRIILKWVLGKPGLKRGLTSGNLRFGSDEHIGCVGRELIAFEFCLCQCCHPPFISGWNVSF